MNGIIIGFITLAIILGLLYFIMRRSSKTKGLSKGSDLFPGQVDDSSEALTSNVTFADVENLIKQAFPPEKHAEVVDALGKYSKGYKATVYHIILQFANGDMDKVKEYVKIADEVGDYRDLAQALISITSK